ncbi:MAG: TerC family protein, partial [Methyloligellaceae bacterium]
ILIFGLALSIALMAIAANWVASLLSRFHWLMYVGIALVFYVAVDMIWRGGVEIGYAMAWIG